MQFCSSSLLLWLLLVVTVLHCSAGGLRLQQQRAGRPLPALRRTSEKGAELTTKLLRLDDLSRTDNDVMEPKRKRSFSGNNAPLDRLSISAMETKQAANRQSKVVGLPRRRVNPPPIDRIGIGRLPSGRG